MSLSLYDISLVPANDSLQSSRAHPDNAHTLSPCLLLRSPRPCRHLTPRAHPAACAYARLHPAHPPAHSVLPRPLLILVRACLQAARPQPKRMPAPARTQLSHAHTYLTSPSTGFTPTALVHRAPIARAAMQPLVPQLPSRPPCPAPHMSCATSAPLQNPRSRRPRTPAQSLASRA